MGLCKLSIAVSVLFASSSLLFAEERQQQSRLKDWIGSLPQGFRDTVLWTADHEDGTLRDWEYDSPETSGGGIFNTGSPDEVAARIVTHTAFSGEYCVQAVIQNAYRVEHGKKAVRLMRWTDKPWDKAGKKFPSVAYYSTWMMIPENYNPKKYPPWDPGDGGWWNILQFKSDDETGESQPVWVLNIKRNTQQKQMQLYFHSNYNRPASRPINSGLIPVNKWFHIEVLYKLGTKADGNGAIAFWLNGEEAFRASDVVTCLKQGSVIWGLGNYTDHIDGGAVPGTATVYFDDSMVSTSPVHEYVRSFFHE